MSLNIRRFLPDPYIIGILTSVALASLLPVRGAWVAPFGLFTKVAVALLFFLYGARLPREVVVAGLVRWRLHLLTLAVTFVLYPLIGLGLGRLPAWLITPSLSAGLVYLCCMPSTIQSSVALVASARGNVAAAICAASASNMVGVILSPLLVGLMLHTHGGGVSLNAIRDIVLELLAPFVLGQVVHPWLGGWMQRHKALLTPYDRGTILLIVYGAFSAAVVGRVWAGVPWTQFVVLAALCGLLLAFIMTVTIRLSRLCGFAPADEVVIAFCGTKKGLAAGVPMASLLFPAASVGLIVLPLMIYHQFQLMLCAALAGRYARRIGDV